MGNEAEFESAGHLSVAAKGDLVGAVQHGGSEKAVWRRIVHGGNDEVLIAAAGRHRAASSHSTTGVLKAGKSVRDLEVQGAHSPERPVDILGPLYLQTVVHRPPDRLQEGQR